MAKVAVLVDESVYNAFQIYSNKSGVPVESLVREALTEWADTVLEARTETLDNKAAKVICIDRAGVTQVADTELATFLMCSEPHPA